MRSKMMVSLGIWALCDEMYQHLEDLYNSANCYFSNDQSMQLKN